MTITEQIAHLRSLMADALEAPWSIDPHFTSMVLQSIGMPVASCSAKYEADLIVAMRNSLPAILDRLERLEAVVDDAIPFIQHCADCGAYRNSDAAPLIQRIKDMKTNSATGAGE